MSKPSQFNNWPSSIHPGYGPYRATIERIVDGDTVYVFVSVGLNKYAYESVRLSGVDAPEIFTGDAVQKRRGFDARAHLESICPPGTKVLMSTHKDAQSFGRYVATLRTASGMNVNDEMNRWLQEQQGGSS